ncbi:relaxase/mobilization nuclease domain-containing protein [Sphingobium sp. AN641]|uniref:relaxase/mobilization nuclease domain-containing protein n=1 Tax=Sphingobium sp. AN641 TaxID=3133443 RepID=UPI0030C104F6
MIFKASTRGDAVALGKYLLNEKRNERVEVHSVDGFMADDVHGAMRDTDAIASGVRSQKYLFHVSLSPPPTERVGNDVFDDAIRRIKERIGLAEQPHIAVFHENDGRRHCHLVISRIDGDTLTVKPLPFFKERLFNLSKEIFVERGWDMPRGMIDREDRDPRNFTLAEYQQAQRMGRDMKHMKTLAQEAWADSDNADSFAKALSSRGLYLARGDDRDHVAISWQGETFSIPRLLGRKAKEVRERLGKPDGLDSVEKTKQTIRETIAPTLRRLIGEAETIKAQDMAINIAARKAGTTAPKSCATSRWQRSYKMPSRVLPAVIWRRRRKLPMLPFAQQLVRRVPQQPQTTWPRNAKSALLSVCTKPLLLPCRRRWTRWKVSKLTSAG